MRSPIRHPLACFRKPLVAALIAGFGIAGTMPVHAESEIEALKRELADQRQLIQQLLSQQESQKKVVSRIEQQAASAPATPAASGSLLPKGMSIYGVLDGGFENITNVTSGGTTGSVTRMPGITGTMASRLGFRVNKEIVPGINGIATLETGFNFDNGTLGQSGRIFGRQLFAGVDTAYGAFTVGRQYSMLIFALGADLLGPNIYAMGSLDPYLPNARYDNSLAWRAKFGNVSLGATYSLARDSAGGAPGSGTCAGELPGAGSNSCRGWSMMAKYDVPRFGIAGAIDEQRGGPGATVFFANGTAPVAFTRPEDIDRRLHLGGYVKLGNSGKLGIGWLGRRVEVASGDIASNTYFVEGAWQFTDKLSIDGGVHRITNDDQDRDANLYVLRGTYAIGGGLSSYLQLGHVNNSAKAAYAVSVGAGVSPAAGGSQTATMAGVRYSF